MNFVEAQRFIDEIDYTPLPGEVIPIFRAVNSRAAWELVSLAERMGERVIEEYGLHPDGQNNSGIGLDWATLSEREGIWVPADYIERTIISKGNWISRVPFDNDEINAFTPGMDPKHRPYVDAVGDAGNGDVKINLLTTDAHWREWARGYSQKLIECIATRSMEYAGQQFRPVLKALTSTYQAEMR